VLDQLSGIINNFCVPKRIDNNKYLIRIDKDEAGRVMFGGWVVIPKNCSMKITVVWYVPPMGEQYSLLLQAQASVDSVLDLTIHPALGTCAQQPEGLHFAQVMDGEDHTFVVKPQGASCVLVYR
jgi:hypothetical protein